MRGVGEMSNTNKLEIKMEREMWFLLFIVPEVTQLQPPLLFNQSDVVG
jgi:hypothetical protein